MMTPVLSYLDENETLTVLPVKSDLQHQQRFQLFFLLKVWAQRGDNRPLAPKVLEEGQLLVQAEVEWEDGRRLPISPFPLLRNRLR